MSKNSVKQYPFDSHPVIDRDWFEIHWPRRVRIRWAKKCEFPSESMLAVVIYLGPKARLRLPLDHYNISKLANAHKRNPTVCSIVTAAYLYSDLPEDFDEVVEELAALS